MSSEDVSSASGCSCSHSDVSGSTSSLSSLSSRDKPNSSDIEKHFLEEFGDASWLLNSVQPSGSLFFMSRIADTVISKRPDTESTPKKDSTIKSHRLAYQNTCLKISVIS